MIGRALRAQVRTLSGDLVLLWGAAAAFVMSLSVSMSIPPELGEAPADARAALAAPFTAVLATYGAILAAIYGSFRYTVDRRDGVIAQRLMLQSRRATLLARVPASALGGAVVALAAAIGGHLALRVSVGGVPVEWADVGATLALGAASGLWGLGCGIVVQAHLLALFVVPASLGAGVVVAMLWTAGAVYLPLLAMLEAFGFDVTTVGIPPDATLDGPVAALVSAGWVLTALLVGGIAFLRRDVE